MAGSGTKQKKDSDLDELEKEIEEDLAKGFDFQEPKKGAPASLIGRTVTFKGEGEDGKPREIEGKVTKQKGTMITVEEDDDDGSFWECQVEDVTLADEEPAPEEPASEEPEKPAKGKKSKPKAEKPAKGKTSKPKAEKPAKAKSKAKAEKPAKGKTSKVEEDPVDPIDNKNTRPRRMLLLSAIKIPKARLRDVDKDSSKYKVMLADIKKRGQRMPIIVESFSNPVLIEGGHRLEIAEELEREDIEVQEDDQIKDPDDRLWNGLLDNEARSNMHWVDLAMNFSRLIKGGKYTAAKIGRALNMQRTQVSRMIGSLKLPQDVLDVARSGAHMASAGVFQELASAPKKVIKELVEVIKSGKPVTIQDVRTEKKMAEAKAAAKAKDKGQTPKPAKPATGQGPKPTQAYTYRDIASGDLGDNVRIRVGKDYVRITCSIPWPNKTFSNFDPSIELEDQMDQLYANEEVGLGSLKALQKALKAAKAELV